MLKIQKVLVAFLLIFGSFSLHAQSYETLWKTIEKNAKTGKFKSNLPIVEKIQKKAQKEGNVSELLMALKGEYSIIKNTKHDEKNDVHSRFFKKLKTIETQLKSSEKWLYEFLVTDFVSDYYNRNQWRINQRTTIDQPDFSSIETWSNLDFQKYLSKQFAYFQKNEKSLRKIKIEKYKKLFFHTQFIDYFATLHDYSSIQYIHFLKNYSLFTINERKANEPKILNTYQNLIQNNDGNAKIYLKHTLINTQNQKNKTEKLIKLYHSEKGDYQVKVAEDIARFHFNKKEFSQSLDWILKAKKEYPKSPFIDNVKNLENQILQAKLNLQMEEEIQANTPIHLVVTTKNVNHFNIEIYKVKSEIPTVFKTFRNSLNDKSFNKINKKIIAKKEFHIPSLKDYQNHTTALSLDALKTGFYILKINAKNIKKSDYQTVIVSENRVIEYLDNSSEKKFQLVNRENGAIQADQKLTLFKESHRRTGFEKQFTITTNENGIFHLPFIERYQNKYIVVDEKTGGIHYIVYKKYQPYREKNKFITQIFLDRAIYRPGQKVYFKVISTEKQKDKVHVITQDKQTIELYDANNEKIANQTFTTNEFGSYHGHFLLPKGKLNGYFRMQINNRSAYKSFKVEAYKRPKFQVVFEPMKDEYQLGKTMTIRGKAISYSGVPVSDAQVNYEIKKNNITWRYFSHYANNDNENSILGTTKTNQKGEFSIEVKLKKNETQKGIQVFRYHIEASVTDLTGETQTEEKNIKVANVSHYIAMKNKPDFFTNEKAEIEVKIKNYNDQILNKSYQVALTLLDEGNQIIRPNFENAIQNAPVMSKTNFLRKFPHDRYEKQNQSNGNIVLKKSNQKGKLDLGKLKAGKYLLHLFNIEGKDTIAIKKTFNVWNKKKLAKNQKNFIQIVPEKTAYHRNEKAKIYVYSAVPNAEIQLNIQDGFGKFINKKLKLKNGVATSTFDLPQNKDVKTLQILAKINAYNASETYKLNLTIKEGENLHLKILTFRDKIEPNSKEQWRIKITGNNHQKKAIELLANMYDQSLDKFQENTYRWKSFRKRPKFISNYHSPYLERTYLSSNYKWLRNVNVRFPQFDWNSRVHFLEGQVAGVGSYKNKVYRDKYPLRAVADAKAISVAEISVDSENVVPNLKKATKKEISSPIKIRENFNETAFFYPQLYTDKNGEVSLEFTSPEALTQWKLMLLAHNEDAQFGYLEKEIITQKQFSVTPNYPRFVREGDVLNFKTKIANLTDENLNGNAFLQIINPITNEDISHEFKINKTQNFNVKENGNSLVEWQVKIPKNRSLMALKIIAKANDFSDGEQKIIPILSNRILVKESLPIFVKEGETKTFELENFNTSKTLHSVSMSLELTTNPIWEVIFALPSLKKNTNSSADVIFNKWFADVLASEIITENPKIKHVFEEYQNKNLLKSNLDKNQELKQILLEETPWVLQSKNETEQMEKVARLFDLNTMKNELKTDWRELQQLQNSDGGFSWYKGYRSSYGTSLYILKNLGKLNLWLKGNTAKYQQKDQQKMLKKLIQYVDAEMLKHWKKDKTIWSNFVLDYLDTRRYWEQDFPLNKTSTSIKNQLIKKSRKAKLIDFTFYGLHRSALLFHHFGEEKLSEKLLTYLKETSTETKNQGVYWKKNLNNWGWYQSKISNHAGVIESFETLQPDDHQFIEEMKMWLITQKEANAWGTSKNTTEVIFTFLKSGQSWTDNHNVKIVWGNKTLKENATGYLKKSIPSSEIEPKMAKISITKDTAGVVQGGLFWEYLEDINQVKSTENYVSIQKELYRKIKTENGEKLEQITKETPLKIGQKVTVRMIVNTDRAMQFIHIKDMRAAGFEPVNTSSGYQWKNGFGFYQNMTDTSANFFIQYLPKGKYVFEHDYICNASGNFSNGITTLQNYYAPQMSSQTKGTKVKIED